ncbi:MAG: phosphate ABC transporter substrate-binding protein PstS, partial [Akkermansia sp.]|nr:phosphate ABC transporter substrate-binding protein PstS [Akkermansia sp.]
MFKNLFIAAVGLCTLAQAETTLTGAGASFPAPVYQKWTYSYSQENPGTQVTYQSMGSGAGINQIKAGTVDFAGSDSPLTLEQQKEAGLVQVPMLTGGVVVIVNLPGVKDGQLKLSKDVLSRIYLGEITTWNDPAIKAINPGLRLPKMKITVVRRADSSGTSFIFTNYLSKISADWKKKVGQGSSVKWPVGIGGQKNPGV